jgi:hemolysin III
MTEQPMTPAERLADGAVHLATLGFVAAAVPPLAGLALADDAGGRPAAALPALLVYGATLALMALASAAYNIVSPPPATDPRLYERLRRLDHAAIFLKIAGTYTPLAVLALPPSQGGPLLAAVWGGALAGALLKLVAPRRIEPVSVPLYLALGWAFLWVGDGGVEALGDAALRLLVSGGLLYSLGVPFHLWRALPFQNAVWHGFVLAGTVAMYAAVVAVLLG